MRKKKHPEHVNHERWLVSYADFITLLFAFFVVMFAVGQTDSNKVGRFTESFSQAMGIVVFPGQGDGVMPGIEQAVPPSQSHGNSSETPPLVSLEDLRTIITEATRAEGMNNVQVVRRRNEFVLRLPDNIVFDSGSASVKEAAIPILRTLVTMLRDRPVDIRVEGHTDNRPIRTANFRSNWELSTARATAVLSEMIANNGIPPERMSAAGYGEFHPIASNDTDVSRQTNRRVDLVVSIHAANPEETLSDDGGTAADASADASAAAVDPHAAQGAATGDAAATVVSPDLTDAEERERANRAINALLHGPADASAPADVSAPAAHEDPHAAPAHEAPHADPHAAPAAPAAAHEAPHAPAHPSGH